MNSINNAYRKVFRDMMIRGPNLFLGRFDPSNGSREFMYGIQTVMEYIAHNVDEETYNKFSDAFTKNMIDSEKK